MPKKGEKSVRVVTAFKNLPRDCLAEILQYFGTPKPWAAIQKTCKQLQFDMRHKETAWGMKNAEFRWNREQIQKRFGAIVWSGNRHHIRKLTIVGFSDSDIWLKTLLENCDIETLHVFGISDMELSDLCFALKEMQGLPLKMLHLHGTVINRRSRVGIEIGDALKTNESLVSLRFSSSSLDNSGTMAIATALKTNRTLSTLNLSSNTISDESAEAIADALKTNETLAVLDLGEAKICGRGLMAIAKVLRDNRGLRSLLLHDIYSGQGSDSETVTGCVKAIAESLKTNENLQILDVSSVFFGSAGGYAFAEALKINKSLLELDLGSNDIGDDAVIAISGALKNNKSLQKIDLTCNDIGDRGTVAIVGCLKDNTSLLELDLGYNTIGEKSMKAVAESLKTNKSLRKLWLNETTIGEKREAEMNKALGSNSSRVKMWKMFM